jgi:tetratricopeptide (TPR) repeat protein
MQKIHIQKRMSPFSAVLLTAVCVGIVIFFYRLIFADDDVSSKTRSDFYGMIGTFAVLIPILFKNAFNNDEYAADLLLNNDSLIIVYKKGSKKSRHTIIKLDDIEKFKADMTVAQGSTGKSKYLSCITTVNIKIKDKKSVNFTVENDLFSFCAYSFMLRLLKISDRIPHFTYSVRGDSETAKKDIEHFGKYGKRIPFWNRMSKSSLIIFSIYMVITAVALSFILYLSWPWFISEEDRNYLSYIEKGRDFYIDDKYDLALAEFNKAMQIHNDDYYLYYYIASTHRYNNQCDAALTEAENGLAFSGEDSTYLYVSGIGNKFSSKESLLYPIIGDCALKSKQYVKAKNAYMQVVQHTTNKYTNIYFKLGKSEYYLGEKEAALQHFHQYKAMVEKYIQEQQNRKYKGSSYDYKDLEKVNNWLQKTEKL